jgi:hypothetical protein
MKKLYSLISLCFVVLVSSAQVSQHVPNLYETKTIDRVPSGIQPISKEMLTQHRNQSDDARALTYYWMNFSDAVDFVFNGGLGENIGFMLMWPDSSVVITDGTGGVFNWYIHSYSHIFDPVSEYHAEYINEEYTLIGDAEEWLSDDHAFHIDSMAFYYAYIRPNNDYVDTLRVYLIGPGSGAVDLDSYTFDSDEDGIFFEEGEDAIVDGIRYDDAINGTYGTGVTEYTFLLDDDDSTSFAVPLVIPVDYTIPDNTDDRFVGAVFTFTPGSPYAFGDTLLDQNDPPAVLANPLNNFYLVTNEEILDSDPVSYTENTNNQGGLIIPETRYQLWSGGSSFLNNYYYSSFGWTAGFFYEHAYVDWHVAPKGAYWLSAKPSPCVDLTLNFTDLSNFVSDPDDATYFWDFGDGSGVSFEQDPVYQYAEPGTYTVTLIVTEGSESFQFERAVIVDFCSDINEIEGLTNFQVYPVPAQNELNIALHFVNPDNIDMQILNMQGQILFTASEKNVTNYTNTFDISSLPAGSYVLEIKNSTDFATKSFIIAK